MTPLRVVVHLSMAYLQDLIFLGLYIVVFKFSVTLTSASSIKDIFHNLFALILYILFCDVALTCIQWLIIVFKGFKLIISYFSGFLRILLLVLAIGGCYILYLLYISLIDLYATSVKHALRGESLRGCLIVSSITLFHYVFTSLCLMFTGQFYNPKAWYAPATLYPVLTRISLLVFSGSSFIRAYMLPLLIVISTSIACIVKYRS